MFDLVAQTFIQMGPYLLSFGVLVFFFTKFLYKPVKNILQKRAENIEADIKNAEENKISAAELKAEYDKRLLNIEAERAAILDEARREATARLNQIMGEAKAEAQITRERARRDIAAEQERVKAEIYQAIIDISTDMAAKLVSAAADKQTQDKLFAEAMDELNATVFTPH
jgi:F-type H+-transporting ATPase subunit b